ncbi:MAG: hypothetical protein IJT44_09765 [Clostridia bacterium]|nr:hypothetical protein [Clostridia bacterium]
MNYADQIFNVLLEDMADKGTYEAVPKTDDLIALDERKQAFLALFEDKDTRNAAEDLIDDIAFAEFYRAAIYGAKCAFRFMAGVLS